MQIERVVEVLIGIVDRDIAELERLPALVQLVAQIRPQFLRQRLQGHIGLWFDIAKSGYGQYLLDLLRDPLL